MPATLITTAVAEQTLTLTTRFPTMAAQVMPTIEMTGNHEVSTHPVRPVVKPTTPQRNVTLKPMQRTDRPSPGAEDRKDRFKPNVIIKTTQMGVLKLQPKH